MWGQDVIVDPDPDGKCVEDLERQARKIARRGVRVESLMSEYMFIAPGGIHRVSVEQA